MPTFTCVSRPLPLVPSQMLETKFISMRPTSIGPRAALAGLTLKMYVFTGQRSFITVNGFGRPSAPLMLVAAEAFRAMTS